MVAGAKSSISFNFISKLFQIEQRSIIEIFKYRQKDYEQHVEILDALEKHDVQLSVELMRFHLEGVRESILNWIPNQVENSST